MSTEHFTCGQSGLKVKISKSYKIKDRYDEEAIIHINKNCVNCLKADNIACKNCHGIVCQVIKKDNKKGANKIMKTTLTDRFMQMPEYYDIMEASGYMDDMEILEILSNNKGEQSMNEPWMAYIWSDTFKTDCANCKTRYSKQDELTPCQKAQKYVKEMGINLSLATNNQIKNIELPDECICREQKQKLNVVR